MKGGTIMARQLHQYDGYVGTPIFQAKENHSTYYDAPADRQCTVPIRDIAEVKQELQQKHGGTQNERRHKEGKQRKFIL